MNYLHEISQTISHNKLRTALTGLAVSWGIFMLIILVGLSNGLLRSFESRAMDSTSNNLIIGGSYTTSPYHGYPEGRAITLKSADAATIGERTGGYVEFTYSTIDNDTATLSAGSEFASGGYKGVTPPALDAERIAIKYGRFVNDLDVNSSRKVIVLSSNTADRLFPDMENPVGQSVTCMGLVFKVIGLYSDNWKQTNYIPFSTARMLAGNIDDVASVTARLRGVSTIEQGEALERTAVTQLASAHDFDPEDTGAVWTWNQFVQNHKIASNMSLLSSITWIIGILTLLSGIVGVSNIMFVSVRERTHEIGIRRAIGARPRNILLQVILESVAITALFGYIGVVIGAALLELLKTFSGAGLFSGAGIDISIAVNVTILLVIAGALAGLFPALKAIKVKPVEALRDE